METWIPLLIPALMAVMLVRLLLFPVKCFAKLTIHSGCGFFCLWLLNSVSGITGITFPMNAVTVLTAGILGLPGIGILAALTVI